jgi:hypothetical protein
MNLVLCVFKVTWDAIIVRTKMQFAAPGWKMLHDASGELSAGGSYLTMVSPDGKDL